MGSAHDDILWYGQQARERERVALIETVIKDAAAKHIIRLSENDAGILARAVEMSLSSDKRQEAE